MTYVAPSLFCADPLNLEAAMGQCEKSRICHYHADIMDGHFVPNIAIGMETLKAICTASTVPVYVHLMVSNPEDYIARLAQMHVTGIYFHFEACDEPERLAEIIRNSGISAGIALNPETPAEAVFDILSAFDAVLVMGVTPGFSGQKFIFETLCKIAKIKEHLHRTGHTASIEVDGGLDDELSVMCAEAGADAVVGGLLNIFRDKEHIADNLDRLNRALESKNGDVIEEIKRMASYIRLNTIKSVYKAGSGHPGGSLSCADILACLYGKVMNIDPADPNKEDRDRLVLSKGHCAPAYYSALAYRGFFNPDELDKLRDISSFLQGHPNMRKTPGVDFSSGSLGQGLSAANGMALYAKANRKNYNIYCIVGDGELEEGQCWEAIMTSAHYGLDKIILFVDNNGLQIDGKVTDVMNSFPVADKFRAFGWDTQEADGHDIPSILHSIRQAKAVSGKPHVIILHTVKGKGVSYMENKVEWHGSVPNKEQYELAVNELTAVTEGGNDNEIK